MKTRKYFLRRAIIQTIFTGVLYLSLPPFAQIYFDHFGDKFLPYTVIGGVILGLGSLMLLFMTWAPALDKDIRDKINKENDNNQIHKQ
jgi:xanthine/uracil permease